ncbi:MAG: membrane protein insertase YidC, partial [Gammaproteobacteria bacterium]|nr:membrane protein insertase YidC [Gammaproteobacteria bacterium]
MTMDNIRIFLWVALLMLLWLVVQAWEHTFQTPPAALPGTGTELSPTPALEAPALPALQAAPDAPPSVAIAPAAPAEPATVPPVRIRTDVLDLELDLKGGNLRQALLPSYPVHKDQPDVPVELLNPAADRFFALQGGLRAADELPQANHLAPFSATAAEYALAPGADELVVPLTWAGDNGVTVTKTYTFRRGSFRIGLSYDVQNEGAAAYQVAEYLQLQRQHRPPERSMFDVETYSYVGPVTYDGKKYTKHGVDDLQAKPFSQSVAQGWLASIQHHFLVAAIPPPDAPWTYGATASADGRYLLNAIGPAQSVAPGASARFSSQLFVGPKLQSDLAATAAGLDKTVDYGVLAILAQPLFWILDKIHGVVGNWGLAIIFCTLLIKLVFYKLSEASGRSMAGMRKLQPRMKALQDRYKDDKQ